MRSSHETADLRLVEVLTGDAQSAIHWLEELGVEFTRDRRRLPARDAAAARARSGCCRSATAPGTRSRSSCARRGRQASGTSFTNAPLRELSEVDGHWRARVGEHDRRRRHVVLAAGGRCYAEAERRGELSTNHPNATGEVTQIAVDLGAEARDLDALQYHPNGGAWPPNMQGYSIPETTRAYGAVLAERRGRGVHRLARPARRGQPGDLRRGRERARASTTPDGRPAVYLDTTRIPESDADVSLPVHAPPLSRRRDRPAQREDLHVPGPPLPERRSRDRHGRRDDARRRLRVRRDRRRHARAQPDDGQPPARVRRLRSTGRSGCSSRRRGADEQSIRSPTCSTPSRTPRRISTSGR